jgi:hypothetical protein
MVRIQTICAKALGRGNVNRKNDLDDLIAAFGLQLQHEHANPERVGCPGQAALEGFASNPGSGEAAAIVDHIRHCAPCLAELRALRMAGKLPAE